MGHYGTLSDQQLAVLLSDGDRQAFTELYDRYKVLLYQHAYKKLGDADLAGDIIQDLFLNLWNKRSDIDAEANVSGYLYIIMRNRILGFFAQQKVRDRYENSVLDFAQNAQIPTDHRIREKQMATMIEQEIEALPEKMKQVFILSRKEHLKNKEIAVRLGLSEHTVATQLKRALKQLRQRLGLLLYLFMLFELKHPGKFQGIRKIYLQTLYPIHNN